MSLNAFIRTVEMADRIPVFYLIFIHVKELNLAVDKSIMVLFGFDYYMRDI